MDVNKTLLDFAYGWERKPPPMPWMTQPMGGGPIEVWDWPRAMADARRMAAHLRSLGLAPGSRVAILSKNCAYFFMADLAIWMAGHVSVAIYPTLGADSVREILDHSEASLLFVGKLDTWSTMAPGVPEGLPRISFPLSPPNDYTAWNDILSKTAPITDHPRRDPAELATIFYTSGSTGRSKGVMQSFRAMSVASQIIQENYGIGPMDRGLSYLPLAHVMERWLVEGLSMVAGGQIFFAESIDTFLQDLRRARPTMFISVPRLWQKFQQGVVEKMPQEKLDLLLRIPIVSGVVKRKILSGLGLGDVRIAAGGSAPMTPELLTWYRSLGVELLEGYGMTEDMGLSHGSIPGRSRVGYVGHPYAGVERRLSPDGEVLVKSPGATMGYYKDPELTRQSFTEDGFFRTGDLGEVDEDGRLRITGRLKELFKTSKGKYVAPVPIENLLNAHPRIELSCVGGSGFPAPYALVQIAESLHPRLSSPDFRAELAADFSKLLNAVNTTLDPHEQLQFLAVSGVRWSIEGGLLTPTMKIKRSALEKAHAEDVERWYRSSEQVVFQSGI